jgi:hypothetical protein
MNSSPTPIPCRSNLCLALAIAFRTFIALSIVYISSLRLGSEASKSSTEKISQWGIRRPAGGSLLFNKYWTGMIPAALSAAASVPMLLEGILHMPSLPVLVMVFVSYIGMVCRNLANCNSLLSTPQNPLFFSLVVHHHGLTNGFD